MTEFSHINTLLIDLDGTLTDPKIGITRSVRYALNKLGYPLNNDTNIDWVIGPPLKASLAQLLNVSTDNPLAELALTAYRERFSVIGLYENELYPHISETLATLQQRGYILFLATAKPTIYARRILEHFKIDHYFTDIYGSELTGERTNKAELIAYILQQQHLTATQCVMIGDREYDILGAKANQMQHIAVTYGYGQMQELQKAQARIYIDNFSQLLDLFTAKTQ